MLVVCSNGNPIRIRTAKSLCGFYLRDMGYHHFKNFVRYDICHTKSRRIRLVKAYCYGNDYYDVSFYTASLKPIEGAGTLYRTCDDPAIRQFHAKLLNRMLNKAIFLVNSQRTTDIDWTSVKELWFEKKLPGYQKKSDYDRLFEEELPF